MKKDLRYMKPAKFRNHLTLSELADKVDKHPRWLRRLEADGRIPIAARVKLGAVEVRLWSPAQVNEIQKIISKHRVGRPAND